MDFQKLIFGTQKIDLKNFFSETLQNQLLNCIQYCIIQRQKKLNYGLPEISTFTFMKVRTFYGWKHKSKHCHLVSKKQGEKD